MSAESKAKVLVIEDDLDIANLVERQLRELGFEVEHSTNGEQGLARAKAQVFALIILDLMLPTMGGMEVCRQLREFGSTVPILMLTGRKDVIDQVLGLEMGADDYITKPFHVMEFNARVRALHRRGGQQLQHAHTPANSTQSLITFRDLTIDEESRQVEISGHKLELTLIEYETLRLLVRNPGKVFSREELLRAVWNSEVAFYAENVTTLMSRLRSKLALVPHCSDYIVTIRGVGYRWIKEDELL